MYVCTCENVYNGLIRTYVCDFLVFCCLGRTVRDTANVSEVADKHFHTLYTCVYVPQALERICACVHTHVNILLCTYCM